jgi:hypothetical protein
MQTCEVQGGIYSYSSLTVHMTRLRVKFYTKTVELKWSLAENFFS